LRPRRGILPRPGTVRTGGRGPDQRCWATVHRLVPRCRPRRQLAPAGLRCSFTA